MFEYNGYTFTYAQIEDRALSKGLSMEEYLQQNPTIKRIDANFPTDPINQEANMGSEDTASSSEDGSSGFLNRVINSPIVNKLFEAALPATLRPALDTFAGGETLAERTQGAVRSAIVTAGTAQAIKEDPTKAIKRIYNEGVKKGGAGFIDTGIEITFDNIKDTEEALTFGIVSNILDPKGENREGISAVTKNIIKAKDAMFDSGYGKFLEAFIPGLSMLNTSREEIDEMREPFRKISRSYQYENTITEEIKKGADADFTEIASRIISDGLTSMPYTIASLNPYTATALGIGIAGDKFIQEVEENPDKTLFQLYGNAITTGGIEMADAYLTRRMFGGAGLLTNGMSKKATEKAVKQLNKGISDKLIDIVGIGVKEGATEIGQAIATRFNDQLWFNYEDLFSEGGFKRFGNGIMKDAYSIIDEGIIGAFSGGGVSTVSSAIQNNEILKARVENLMMSVSTREQRNKLVKEYVQREVDIKKALELGTEQGIRRARALKGINRKTAAKISEIQAKNRMVIDNITGKDLQTYASNVDTINALADGNITKSTQREIDKLVTENNQIFDKALKENFGENYSFTEAAAKQLGLKTRKAKTTAEFNKLIKKLSGKTIKDSNGVNGVFIGKGQIIINESVALEQGAVGVGSHEILHPILNAMVGDANQQQQIVEEFKNTLTRSQRRWTDNEMKRQGKQEGTSEYYTEYLNVFSEGLVKNRISFDLNFGEQVRDWVKNLFVGKGFKNIDFRSGRGVYNFMKAYNQSIKDGKLSKEVLSALDAKAVKEAEALGKQIQKSEISNEIQKIYDDKGFNGAFEILEKYEGMANKHAQRFRDVPGFATNSDILVDEILTGRRGVIDLIRAYNPGSGVPLAAYINKYLSSRVIEIANRVLDTNFKSDVTEARGVTDTVVEENVKEDTQRPSLRLSLNLTQEVIDRVKDAVVKSFGTRMPEVTSKQFKKQLVDNYKTFLKPTMATMMGTEQKYKDFISENFKLIYDILPQSIINKRFKPFAEPVVDENGKQLREKTAQGNKIFRKKKITKQEFVDYFTGPNVGGSTKGARKTALSEALAQEVAFDATLDVLRNPDVFEKVKAVAAAQEIDIADNYLSQVASKIDRGVDFQFSRESTNAADLYAIRDAIMEGNLQETFPNIYDEILSAAKGLGLSVPSAFKGVTYESYVTKVQNDKKSKNLKVIGDGLMGPTGTDVVFELTKNNGNKSSIGTEIKNGVRDQYGSATFKTNKEGSLETTNPLMADMIPFLAEKLEIYEELHKRAEEIQGETIEFKFPQTGYLESTWNQLKDEFISKERNIQLIFDNAHLIEKFYNKKGVYAMYIGNKGLFYLGNNKYDLKAPRLESKMKTYMSLRSSGTRADGKVTLTLRGFNALVNGKNLPKNTLISDANFETDYFQASKEAGALDAEFNDILQDKFKIGSQARYTAIDARREGKNKGMFNFFIPHSAEDFQGLMYAVLPKGKKGEVAQQWFRQNLFQPYAVAMENINRDRMALMNNFKALKKKINTVPKILNNKIPDSNFTYQDAVRVYIWNKQGMDIPNLSDKQVKDLSNTVKKDKDLRSFATELIGLNGDVGYIKPGEAWDVGTITTDLVSNLNEGVRGKHLAKWKENVDIIFSQDNLNKLEAANGKAYVSALKNVLRRMETGRNRMGGGNPIVDKWLDWLNNSVGAIMFINVRSAVLQTISTVNYMNWSDNNPLKAGLAYANQPQYWKDFLMIFNSDYLKQRRGGLELNVQENEIADMAKRNGVTGVISYILNKGFVLTRMADSWAIANGGAAMYRNRVNTYKKQGLSEQEAEQKAFADFRELTEEAQQSSRPDRISQQQASGLGRVILAFANTPMQYTRLMKRGAQDLVAGRGDWKTNASKIMYYGVAQNLLFNAMQQALFALGFDDEEDEKKKDRYTNVANGMADSILRGTGVAGAAVSAGKNFLIDLNRRSKKPRPEFNEAPWKLLDISPPLSSKLKKLRSAGYAFDYNMKEIQSKGLTLENPAAMAIGQTVSALTNVPLDRVLRLYDNARAAVAEDTEAWQRVALLLGWSTWELNIEDDKKSKKPGIKTKTKTKIKKTKTRL